VGATLIRPVATSRIATDPPDSAAPDESNTRPCSAAIVWPLADDAIRIDSIATPRKHEARIAMT
jgi:hypothetical protein